mmetsp:Transcript_7468/g.17092  ORF Transcript_7468/g.17092 Transcript_7468/m.17092 type:complete len:213 (+) Transcript_7468:658-1296(+)
MVDASLHVDQHLGHPLVLALVAVKLLGGLGKVAFKVVDGLPPSHVALAAKLELLHSQPEGPALLGEPVDGSLVLCRKCLKALLRVLLGEELLDDLVRVADACGLPDGVEGLLVVQELAALLVRVVACNARGGVGVVGLLQLALALLLLVQLRLQHLLPLLQPLVHLDALLHQRLLLLHLLVALVPLLHDPLLEAVQLGLGHLLGVVGVVREQ